MPAAKTMSEMKAHILAKAVEDAEFRASLVSDPKSAVSTEMEVQIPDAFSIVVHEDDFSTVHLVLPVGDRLTQTELAEIAGGVDVNWDSVNIS